MLHDISIEWLFIKMSWQPDQPYNVLPHLPPAIELESIALLKACIPARVALAELKQAGQLLPNQGLLVNTLPLLEAKDSSEIENIVIPTRILFNAIAIAIAAKCWLQ